MTIEFKLPELGEGVDSADVARIFVEEGDQIEADQNVLELETEKAVADLPCSHAGKISKLHVSAGETIKVGQTILSIEAGDEDKKSEKSSAGKVEDKQDDDESDDKDEEADAAAEGEEPSNTDESEQAEEAYSDAKEKRPAKQRGDDHTPPPAGPATRRLARELDIDIADLEPVEGGRIKQEDVVRAYVESGKAASLAKHELPDFEQFGSVERRPLNKIQRTASERLAMSWRLVPHVTQHGLADITELEAARRGFITDADESQPKITLTAIAVKAVVGVLRQLPQFNASLDTARDELVIKHYFHIGIAVNTDHGLLVPVIRDADRKSVIDIAADIEQLSDKARQRQLDADDMRGGTFTISNQGGIGGGHFTPIVNWPEVAILGIGRAQAQLEMREGEPRERLKLPLSLSYDHCAINGADAARFMHLLEDALSGTFELLVAS